MSYKYSLEKIKRLADVKVAKDIKQLSHAQFPGTHCPLFGVALTADYIDDLHVLVIGTDECTFYTKTFNMQRISDDSDMKDNFLSFVLNQDDVVFGCQDKLKETITYIDQHHQPKAILLVTTCVLEIIGEDIEAVIFELQNKIQAKLLVVHTEHFKCNNHIPGIEKTLTALAELMESQPLAPQTVNILGHRYGGIKNTELFKTLQNNGIDLHLVLPSSCSIASIKTAPAAALNIVTDFTALPLAKKMQELYGNDYVYFDKFLNFDRIEKGYQEIAAKLQLKISDEVQALKEAAEKSRDTYYPLFKGKKFIYGNTPMLAFELSSFLSSMDMLPILIQARDLYDGDELYINEILAGGHNPYVSMIANIAPLHQLYDELMPDIYIGHEYPMVLLNKGITQVVLDGTAKNLGFEVPLSAMQTIAKSIETFISMSRKDESHHATTAV